MGILVLLQGNFERILMKLCSGFHGRFLIIASSKFTDQCWLQSVLEKLLGCQGMLNLTLKLFLLDRFASKLNEIKQSCH